MSTRAQKTPARLPANERREQILDVTLGLIAGQGFEALSIDAVAKAAGITRPVVYGFFDDQHALLHALVDREESRVLAQLMQAIPEITADSDPEQILIRAIEAFLAAVREWPDTWRLILLPSEGLPREIRHRINGRREQVIVQLDRLVAWGVERRGGPHGIDTDLLARMVVGFAQDAARLTLADPERYAIERMSKFARALLDEVPGGGGRVNDAGEPPPFDFAAIADS